MGYITVYVNEGLWKYRFPGLENCKNKTRDYASKRARTLKIYWQIFQEHLCENDFVGFQKWHNLKKTRRGASLVIDIIMVFYLSIVLRTLRVVTVSESFPNRIYSCHQIWPWIVNLIELTHFFHFFTFEIMSSVTKTLHCLWVSYLLIYCWY